MSKKKWSGPEGRKPVAGGPFVCINCNARFLTAAKADVHATEKHGVVGLVMFDRNRRKK